MQKEILHHPLNYRVALLAYANLLLIYKEEIFQDCNLTSHLPLTLSRHS